MIADYNTKPVLGRKFKLFRDRIMNLSGKHHRIGQQECVGLQNNKDESNESNESNCDSRNTSSKKKVSSKKKPVVVSQKSDSGRRK